MDHDILKTITVKVDGLDGRVGRLEERVGRLEERVELLSVEIAAMRVDMADMRASNARLELSITKQIASMMDTQEILMDIARDSQRLFHKMEAVLERYDSDKVAVDVVITDHEKRIGILEQCAV